MSDIDRDWQRAIQHEAEQRQLQRANRNSNRPLSEGYELVGLSGEIAFSMATGYAVDFRRDGGSDGGVDFTVPVRMTVDVKTSRKPANLIAEQGKVSADVYVLGGYDDELRQAALLGWEYGAKLKRAPVREFSPGIVSHYIPRAELRPMDELYQRIMRLV